MFPRVDCKRKCWVDAFVEFGHVCVDVVLRNLAVTLMDVVDEVSNGHVVEAFIRVVKFGIVDGLNGIRGQVDCDALDVLIRGPCTLRFIIVCL